MPDFPISRPVLAGKSALSGAQISLEALPEGHLLQVLGETTRPELEANLASSGLTDSSVRPAGYRQWYVAGERHLAAADVRNLSSALPRGTFLSDQSHGRVRIRLSGPQARVLLARGTAVDLAASIFASEQTAVTLFNHIAVHLIRSGTDAFELIVLRSFAEALYEELEHLARSFLSERTRTTFGSEQEQRKTVR